LATSLRAVAPDAVDLQPADGQGPARLEDGADRLQVVARGGREEVDLVLDGEDLGVLVEQSESGVAAGGEVLSDGQPGSALGGRGTQAAKARASAGLLTTGGPKSGSQAMADTWYASTSRTWSSAGCLIRPVPPHTVCAWLIRGPPCRPYETSRPGSPFCGSCCPAVRRAGLHDPCVWRDASVRMAAACAEGGGDGCRRQTGPWWRTCRGHSR